MPDSVICVDCCYFYTVPPAFSVFWILFLCKTKYRKFFSDKIAECITLNSEYLQVVVPILILILILGNLSTTGRIRSRFLNLDFRFRQFVSSCELAFSC